MNPYLKNVWNHVHKVPVLVVNGEHSSGQWSLWWPITGHVHFLWSRRQLVVTNLWIGCIFLYIQVEKFKYNCLQRAMVVTPTGPIETCCVPQLPSNRSPRQPWIRQKHKTNLKSGADNCRPKWQSLRQILPGLTNRLMCFLRDLQQSGATGAEKFTGFFRCRQTGTPDHAHMWTICGGSGPRKTGRFLCPSPALQKM